jgi:hypothetical protein
LEEPATEAKGHLEEPVAKEAPEEFHNTISEPAGKELVMQEPTEEDRFVDAEDQRAAESQSEMKDEPAHVKPLSKLENVMESLFHKTPVHGDSYAEPGATEEPTTVPHAEKELQVEAKPAMREQHTKVDSGIDVETPTKKPLGKFEPVVEIKPATDIDESGMA